MKYVKLTLPYMRKHWLFFMIVTLVPALLFGVTSEPITSVRFFFKYFSSDFDSFGDLFFSLSEMSWLGFLFAFVSAAALVTAVSFMCGTITRDFRLGDFNRNNFMQRANDNFIYVAIVVLALFIISQVQALFIAVFAYLWYSVLSSRAVAFALTLSCALVVMLFNLAIICLSFLWLPTMVVSGVRGGHAIASSIRAIGSFKRLTSIFVAVLFPLLPIGALYVLVYLIDVKFLSIIIYVFSYMLFIAYYCTLMFTSYYSINEIDREDLRPKYTEVNE